jgi:hypothetical protein
MMKFVPLMKRSRGHSQIDTLRKRPQILRRVRHECVENLDIRVSPDEKSAIQAAVERDSRTASDWARLTLLRAAKKGAKKCPVK